MVTKQAIINKFNAASVTQIGSKQLFTAQLQNNVTVLISYYTIVGFERSGIWYVTDRKYSVTTSRQLTTFARNNNVHTLTSDDFDNQLHLLGVKQ